MCATRMPDQDCEDRMLKDARGLAEDMSEKLYKFTEGTSPNYLIQHGATPEIREKKLMDKFRVFKKDFIEQHEAKLAGLSPTQTFGTLRQNVKNRTRRLDIDDKKAKNIAEAAATMTGPQKE